MLESYIRTGDGKDYVDVDCVMEALCIKDDENIFRAIEKLREDKDLLEELHANHISQLNDYAELAFELGIESGDAKTIKDYINSLKRERDELKEKCDRMKKRANAVYGASCGYSGDKAPAFLCDVIGYSWEFGAIDTPFTCKSVRVVLELTPTANYKGTFDLEDLKKYIQNYGREKKLGIIESVDYQNAKAARAELAFLYKQVLGKEKLDRDLSPHEVMKAILDAVKKLRVVQPARSKTTRERIEYIFSALTDYRNMADSNFNKAEEFRKEKQAVENVLAELRAKIREIYRSVVDDEWDEYLAYTSALNDINEEYKRVVRNFEERTKDLSKAQQELDRYRLAVGSLLDIPKEARDDINAIERSFTFSKKKYESLKEFRDNVCEIFDIPSSMADEQILKELHDIADRYDELEDFRADICGILGIEGMLGTPQQNDKYILEQIEKLSDDNTRLDRYARLRSNICTALCLGGETSDEDILKRVRMTKDCHDKLCKDYAKLHDDYVASQKQVKGFTNRCDSLENLQRDLWNLRRNAIEDLKSRGFFFRPEENETLPEIYDKLLKRYDDYFSRYKEQYRLRQCWHVRWESENERANGVQKALDREREKCRVKDISLETAKKQYEKVCGNLETVECALNGMKSKVRSLQEEKTKVISALGQDIWDDCLK